MRNIDTGGNRTISHDELRAYLFRIKKFDRKEAFPRRKRQSGTPSLGAIGRSITASARMQGRGMPGMEHSGRGAMGFRSGSVANTTGEGFRPHRCGRAKAEIWMGAEADGAGRAHNREGRGLRGTDGGLGEGGSV